MSQQGLLAHVVRVLNDLGIEYMVSGSLVSSLQGEPRATHDIDIVVALERRHVKVLPKAFPPPEYYLPEDSILDALKTEGMFNLIAVKTGDKVDFWVLTNQPFDISRFARKYVEKVMGMEIAVSSPEDTILMKLSWAHKSGGWRIRPIRIRPMVRLGPGGRGAGARVPVRALVLGPLHRDRRRDRLVESLAVV
jgi:hypothetical protein